MKDFQLTKHNLNELFETLSRDLEDDAILIITTQKPGTGKWGMARLWYAWMNTTAQWMANNGARMPLCVKPDGSHYGKRLFNKDDAHSLFTSQWLGLDVDGNRLSWAKKSHDGMRAATKGERFNAMLQHENYALERGIMLFQPRDSEYRKLHEEQNQ